MISWGCLLFFITVAHPPIRYEAKATKTNNHHGPSGDFWHRSRDCVVSCAIDPSRLSPLIRGHIAVARAARRR
jgi:hypothetical protein